MKITDLRGNKTDKVRWSDVKTGEVVQHFSGNCGNGFYLKASGGLGVSLDHGGSTAPESTMVQDFRMYKVVKTELLITE